MNNSFRDLYDIYINPQNYFTSLGEGGDDVVQFDNYLFRREYFREYFEYRFMLPDGSITLMIIPLRDSALHHLQEISEMVTRLNSSLFGEFNFVDKTICRKPPVSTTNRLSRRGDGRVEMSVTMAIQKMPPGVLFTDYVNRASRGQVDRLHLAIRQMERYVDSLNVQLNNLGECDFIVGDDELLYPCNLVNASISESADNHTTVDNLNGWIEYIRSLKAPKPESMAIKDGGYTYNIKLYPGHLECGLFYEQRAKIRHESGYGFIDESNKIVIEPIYEWCDRFHENRVVVKGVAGYGLLDPWGSPIIEPIYDELRYNHNTALCIVRKGQQWAYFSYTGEELTPFKDRYISYEITREEVSKLEDYKGKR